ncbi:TetR/AcrR family transcriptional regulator [Anaerovorax odorimutans]|uniref:TetR/AcrR family transcriptional regulator n=1 Tax=Anaerovorax odorimutans TaxID=109327 RepID=A0ABT1RQ59_9FIRM|nr:helix-turn-helix domain-containing protein [Anaerovorax odorimutans]MCQ4637298.1 TetR/AcrR family transcriptional regulator [Anaerovorax odorimutans]
MKNRMDVIFQAASHLFINKGYARTQMKDIAKEIGLSTGMLYVYFGGKEDLLNFIMKGAIDPDFINREFELPIDPGVFVSLEEEIMEVFENNTKEFASHLDDLDQYPLEQMLSDAFDIISRYGIGCLMIEKNPDALKKLVDIYKEYRKCFFDQMLDYVTGYIKNGTFREAEHIQYCVQLIIETLSWWGMHIMNDAFELEKDLPVETAKKVCLDNLIHAYKC